MWNVRANFIMSIDNSIVSIFHTHFVWIKCTPQNVGMFIAATRATHSPWMGLLSARCSTLWRINKATVKCMYATRESHAHFDKTITTTRNEIAAISAGVEFLLYHSNNVVHTSNPPLPVVSTSSNPPPCRVNLVRLSLPVGNQGLTQHPHYRVPNWRLCTFTQGPKTGCKSLWWDTHSFDIWQFHHSLLLATLYNPILNTSMVSSLRFYGRIELYGSPDVRNCWMPNFICWAILSSA